jgi:cellobiose transport system permease protein
VSATSTELVGSTTDDERTRRPRKKRGAQHGPAHEEPWAPYLFISPFFILFSVFGVFTLAYTFWVSLHDWSLTRWHGRLRRRRQLRPAARRPAVLEGDDQHLLDPVDVHRPADDPGADPRRDPQRPPAARVHLFRSGLLVPNITSVVAIAIVFQSLFARQNGPDQRAHPAVRLRADQLARRPADLPPRHRLDGQLAVHRLQHADLPRGDAGDPAGDYEAAQIDGANRIQRFWKISLPLLRPAILFAVVLSVIGSCSCSRSRCCSAPAPGAPAAATTTST